MNEPYKKLKTAISCNVIIACLNVNDGYTNDSCVTTKTDIWMLVTKGMSNIESEYQFWT